MTLEIDIEEEVCKQALDLGVTNVKMKAAGHRGWPDRMFLIPGGKPLFIEFKRDTDLSANQVIIIRRLRYYGYQVEVCDYAEEALEHIRNALTSNVQPTLVKVCNNAPGRKYAKRKKSQDE